MFIECLLFGTVRVSCPPRPRGRSSFQSRTRARSRCCLSASVSGRKWPAVESRRRTSPRARADEVGGERLDSGTESAVHRRPKTARHEHDLVVLVRLETLAQRVLVVSVRRQDLVRLGLGRRAGSLPAVHAVRPVEARGSIRACRKPVAHPRPSHKWPPPARGKQPRPHGPPCPHLRLVLSQPRRASRCPFASL